MGRGTEELILPPPFVPTQAGTGLFKGPGSVFPLSRHGHLKSDLQGIDYL